MYLLHFSVHDSAWLFPGMWRLGDGANALLCVHSMYISNPLPVLSGPLIKAKMQTYAR